MKKHNIKERIIDYIYIIWCILGSIFMAISLAYCFSIVFSAGFIILVGIISFYVLHKKIIQRKIKLFSFSIMLPLAMILAGQFADFCKLGNSDCNEIIYLLAYVGALLMGLFYSFILLIPINWCFRRMAAESREFCKLIPVAFGIPFLVLIYLPSVTLLSNANDYKLSFFQFMIPQCIMFVLSSFGLVLLLAASSKALRSVITVILFISFLCFFFQAEFMNRSLGIIDGYSYRISDNIPGVIINMIIWLAIIAAVIILKKLKSEKFSLISFRAILIIEGYMMLMLALKLISAPEFAFKMTDYCLLGDDQFKVSSDENVIILMFDSLDNEYARDILKEDEDIFKPFEDFTFYNNTCSVYDMTGESLPSMMTGTTYDGKSVDYMAFYDRLHDNGYTINFYNYEENSNPNPVIEEFDNYLENDYENVKYKVNYQSVLENSIRLSAFQVFPMILKELPNSGTVEFNSQVMYFGNNDKAIYDNQEFRGNLNLSMDENSSKYMVVQHLDGIHFPKDDYYEAEKECFDIAAEYIEQLKELGLYDKATIIITSDHGLSDHKPPLTYPTASTPVFMIKKPNDNYDIMQISDAPEYHTDLLKTILVCSKLYYPEDGDRFGMSVFDFDEGDIRERTWCNTGLRDTEYPGTRYAYTFMGDYDDLQRQVESKACIELDY